MLQRGLLTLLFITSYSISSLSAQIALLIPETAFLLEIANANQRDSTHLDALSHLLLLEADNRMMGFNNSEGSSEYMDSLLQEAYLIGDELGGAFPIRARIAQIRMDARVCPQYKSERREETLIDYQALHDSLVQHPGLQSSQLLLEAYNAIYWQCSPSWYASEMVFEHAEALYKDSFLTTAQRLLIANYLISKNLDSGGDIDRALALIQETLRELETIEGEYGMKNSTYLMLSSFFEQATADYEKANEMLFLAKENSKHLDVNRYGNISSEPDAQILRNYEQQGKYAQAETLLDSLRNIEDIQRSSEKNIAEIKYLTSKLKYCRKLEKGDCSEHLELLIAYLNSPLTADLSPHSVFNAASQVALYYHYKEEETSAYPWYLKADEDLQKLRFFDVKVATELRDAFGAELERRGEFKEALSVMNSVSRLQQYQLDNTIRSAQKRALYDLNVREYRLSQQRAEEVATVKENEVKSNRRFYLGLLGAAGLILVLGAYSYWRSRRDARKLAAQKKLVDQSLSEKEVLLKEIHHRVKNNLQIISSLLQKQARFSSDGDAQRLAKEGQDRIQSMALVHENLYQSEQLSGVNIRSYLEDLGANISRSHSKPDVDIQLELAVDDEYLDLDTAIPVGLILNELLTNAYKYAFPEGKSGKIRVVFQRIKDHFELEVNDNGVGLPSDHADRSSKSLGHNLVKGLVRQLEGNIKWLKPEQGTTVQIEF
jgi:two-component sensor histidine kinase